MYRALEVGCSMYSHVIGVSKIKGIYWHYYLDDIYSMSETEFKRLKRYLITEFNKRSV